jgi:2,3-bisphosphoglycerate-independent phosphoglycerate mutase
VSDLLAFVKVVSIATNTDIRLASMSGRYYAMDRDRRWDRVELAWKSIVCAENLLDEDGKGQPEALEASYAAGVTDEFFKPAAFCPEGVRDGDTVLFFNFRPDRARELTRAFADPGFAEFERRCVSETRPGRADRLESAGGAKRAHSPCVSEPRPSLNAEMPAQDAAPEAHFVCMTEYDPSFGLPVMFAKERVDATLADVLSEAGLRQLHIAETEKYAHVTFFLNGGEEAPKAGEERILVPSPKVATYDMKPEMSAVEVTDALVEAVRAGRADVYIVNYANGDMVGHTGVYEAAVTAIETLDLCLRRLVAAMEAAGGVTLLTADHGNADKMADEDGRPFTAHTSADVPLVAVFPHGAPVFPADVPRGFVGGEGRLADVAPTFLDMIGIEPPATWTGRSLLA